MERLKSGEEIINLDRMLLTHSMMICPNYIVPQTEVLSLYDEACPFMVCARTVHAPRKYLSCKAKTLKNEQQTDPNKVCNLVHSIVCKIVLNRSASDYC